MFCDTKHIRCKILVSRKIVVRIFRDTKRLCNVCVSLAPLKWMLLLIYLSCFFSSRSTYEGVFYCQNIIAFFPYTVFPKKYKLSEKAAFRKQIKSSFK